MSTYDDHVLNHADVLHYWKLNEASGTSFADSGPGSKALTLSSSGGHSTSGGPIGDMGYVNLNGRSLYNTTINLSTLQSGGFAMGAWVRCPTTSAVLAGLGDWQSNGGPMLYATRSLYYNGTIRLMDGTGAMTMGNVPNEWFFIVATYDTAANSYRHRFWHNGIMETNNTIGSALSGGASRFEVGSYATGAGGTASIDYHWSGVFILDAVPTDEWIEEAYDLFNPNRQYDAYEQYVISTSPSHFWSLQNDTWPLPGTKGPALSGTVGSYPSGPSVNISTVGAKNNTLALNERVTDTTRNNTSMAYTYGGWFKFEAGEESRRIPISNWDNDGSMIYVGDNSTGANNDFAIYHNGQIMQADPPGGASFDLTIWHHYMVRWDGTTQSFFIDGEEVASVGRTATLGSSTVFDVGGYNTANTSSPHMTAAYVGWWENIALTDAQILNLYTAAPVLWSGSDAPMVMG